MGARPTRTASAAPSALSIVPGDLVRKCGRLRDPRPDRARAKIKVEVSNQRMASVYFGAHREQARAEGSPPAAEAAARQGSLADARSRDYKNSRSSANGTSQPMRCPLPGGSV